MAISSAAPTLTLPCTPSIINRTSSSTKSLSFSSSNSSFFTNTLKPLTIAHGNRSNLLNGKKKGLSCTCLFGLGVPELVVIAGVVALVFGPKKLPEVGRSIGKTVKSFQQSKPQPDNAHPYLGRYPHHQPVYGLGWIPKVVRFHHQQERKKKLLHLRETLGRLWKNPNDPEIWIKSTAFGRVVATITPFPAARPSALTTTRAPCCFMYFFAAIGSVNVAYCNNIIN